MKKYRVRGHKMIEVSIEVEANSPVEAILNAGERPVSDWAELANLRETIVVVGSDLIKKGS